MLTFHFDKSLSTQINQFVDCMTRGFLYMKLHNDLRTCHICKVPATSLHWTWTKQVSIHDGLVTLALLTTLLFLFFFCDILDYGLPTRVSPPPSLSMRLLHMVLVFID